MATANPVCGSWSEFGDRFPSPISSRMRSHACAAGIATPTQVFFDIEQRFLA